MEFEKACSEMYYILEHMNPIDKKRIPEAAIQFFRYNRSIFYKVNLDVTKRLDEQELKDETKAFIQILKEKYFSNKELKEKKYQDLDEHSEEPLCEDIIKTRNEEVKSTELIIIKKENKILEFLKRILKIFRH